MLEFKWDEANRNHIARHGIILTEIEYVLRHPTLPLDRQDWHLLEERFAEAGASARGRILEVIWTPRSDKIRVVTAWDATQDVVQEYFETRAC